VSRQQLLGIGVTSQAVKTATRDGRLITVYRGVYAVGLPALSDRGRVVAALLAAGPHAIANHWTAAALYRLIASLPAVLDVTLACGDRRPRAGLRIHRPETPPEAARWDGLALTTPLRTLADLGHPRTSRARRWPAAS
jgi:hypothetical protein